MNLTDLKEWFSGRPKWQQEAARLYVESGTLSPADIQELLEMCIAEACCQELDCKGLSYCAVGPEDTTRPLRLKSISGVQGINALAPTKPLEFGGLPLCLVYGRNGAGKSLMIPFHLLIMSTRKQQPEGSQN